MSSGGGPAYARRDDGNAQETRASLDVGSGATLQRHSSALALTGLAIVGLTLGGVLGFDVNPIIEVTHDAIVATRRLEQHDAALGLAVLRVHRGLSGEQASVSWPASMEPTAAQATAVACVGAVAWSVKSSQQLVAGLQ